METTIIASVIFQLKKDGGRQDFWFNGMKPSFNFEGKLTSCSFYSLTGEKIIKSGLNHELKLVIYNSQDFIKRINPGISFSLNSGAKIIANGVIKKIIGTSGI